MPKERGLIKKTHNPKVLTNKEAIFSMTWRVYNLFNFKKSCFNYENFNENIFRYFCTPVRS